MAQNGTQNNLEPIYILSPFIAIFSLCFFSCFMVYIGHKKDIKNQNDLLNNRIKDLSEICKADLESLNECSICACIIRKLKCNHIYHEKCIINWLLLKTICPMCREILNI